MARVVHFEIHVENPERAIKFYSDVFGWQFSNWGGPQEYWLIKTGEPNSPGIDGGMIRRRGSNPSGEQAVVSYVCTIQVDNCDESAAKAVSRGGEIVVPKMPIPGMGWLLYCKDTEGNIFGITHMDPSAK